MKWRSFGSAAQRQIAEIDLQKFKTEIGRDAEIRHSLKLQEEAMTNHQDRAINHDCRRSRDLDDLSSLPPGASNYGEFRRLDRFQS